MSISEAQKRATRKYHKNHYEQIIIRVPKGKRDEYRAFAESRGESLAEMIRGLIEKEMEKAARK